MDVREILGRFRNVKAMGQSRWQVSCPCHNDKTASLTISEKDNKILMHCHAGCRTGDIVSAVGLQMSNLFAQEHTRHSWKDKFKDLEAVYDYGEYVKLRLAGKKILYGHIVNDEFVSGMPCGTDKTLYRLKDVEKAVSEHRHIFITEGEKDVDTLAKMGFCATTAGGVGDWQKKFAPYFTGADVVILPDNDVPGKNLANEIRRDLRNFACKIKIVPTSQAEKGDVTDYVNEGHGRADIIQKVTDVMWEYAPWLFANAKGEIKVNADLLADSISKSLDYIALQKRGTDFAEFYIYDGGVYKKSSKIEFKACIKKYIPLGSATDNTLNNVYNLLLCSENRIFDFDDVDSDENIINVKNGLYNIKIGELLPHNRNYLSILQLNCNYNTNTKCTEWQRYIDTLCTDRNGDVDKDKENVLQEWLGLAISNVNVAQKVKKCLALHSSLGNTGKSVFLTVMRNIMGESNTINIPMQMMAQRFALSDLYGKRADIVGDQSADDIEDSSVFKQLTGGDAVKVEFKGKQSFDFVYKGVVVISCNNLPFFKDDKGGHIFERFTIINCENVISPEKRDGTLPDRLTAEADGIFLWAMEGLKRLIANGYRFTQSKAVDETIDKYRGDVDSFYKFITENYIITGEKTDMMPKTELEKHYLNWCDENEYSAMKKRNIAERAEKSGIVLTKYHGNWFYRGMKLQVIETVEKATSEDLPPEFNKSEQISINF